MALQHINRELARDEARDGRDARVRRLLFHHLAGLRSRIFNVCCFCGPKEAEGWESGEKQVVSGRGVMLLTGDPCAMAIWDVLAMRHHRPEFPRVMLQHGK
jgi:hypothetical protein